MLDTLMPLNSYLVISENISLAESVKNKFRYSLRIFNYIIYYSSGELCHVDIPHWGKIIVIGHIYNPIEEKIGQEAVQHLANSAMVHSEEFYKILSLCSGRFVILINKGDELEVIPDACSSLPVNYLNCFKVDNAFAISSHSYFIQKIFSLPENKYIKTLSSTRFYCLGIRHCPADLTEVEGVKLLTPNLCLNFRSGKLITKRIFPCRPRQERDAYDVVNEVAEILKNSVHCLLKFGKPVFCAMSGGVDSRMTLAASVSRRDEFNFFTFSGEGNASRDLLCTRRLAKNLGLNFEEIDLGDNPPDEDFQDLYKKLQGLTRHRNMQETFSRKQHFGMSESFEVRSSISEISRNFIKRKFRIEKLALSSGAMVPIYKRVPFSQKWHSSISQVFGEWIKSSQFENIEKNGYDWLDFFYWEVRVGTWQSLVLQDADYYTNPTVIFNNRYLLELMLSTPEKFRQDDTLQKMIMARLDADVLQMPTVKNHGKQALIREAVESFYLRFYQILVAR